MARPKKNNSKDRISISFTEFDEEVYDYLKSLKNASALVKYLVRQYMDGGVATPPPSKITLNKGATEEYNESKPEVEAPEKDSSTSSHSEIEQEENNIKSESSTDSESVNPMLGTGSIFSKKKTLKENKVIENDKLEDYKFKDDLLYKSQKLGNMKL